MAFNYRTCILISWLITFLVALTLLIGLIFAIKGRNNCSSQNDPFSGHFRQDLNQISRIRQKLLDGFSPQNIRNNLKTLTQQVHVAGTPENLEVLDWMALQYKLNGLETKTHDYQVLLSYPDYTTPNTVDVQYSGSDWHRVSNGTAVVLGPQEAKEQESDPRARIYWNGYSKNGVAQGPIVYANFGTRGDYEFLDSQGISLKGAIVLTRYGYLWRGAKVSEAEKRGAIGVLIYSDPQQYGPPKSKSEAFTFPESVYLPKEGVQRGSLMMFDGDPLTPFYPSKNYTFRPTNQSELRAEKVIPDIPVMPVSAEDAKLIFNSMRGLKAEANFTGGLRGVTYRLTSGDNVTFRLDVKAKTEVRTIRDVSAILRGNEEPDEWIMFSNHVDAWTFGSFDPNSGTAILLEMSRVLMSAVNQTGWRPRRSIVFCSWDDEEYGLVGSNEFVEEYFKLLQSRAVSLINIDAALEGNITLNARGVPLLYRALMNAAQQVPNPNQNEVTLGRKTVYDSWKFYTEHVSSIPDHPAVVIPGSGSDFQRFLTYVGVPIVALTYVCPGGCYYLYHSMYEVEWANEHLADPNFKVSVALGQLWLEFGRNLADSLVIPFNTTDYPVQIMRYLANLDGYLHQKGMDHLIPDYDKVMNNLQEANNRFLSSCLSFQKHVDFGNSGKGSLTLRQIRMLNKRMVDIEKSFINPKGVYPERQLYRHVIFAPSIHNDYAGLTFPGIVDCVEFYYEQPAKSDYWLKEIRTGLSVIQYSIESAILELDLAGF